MDLVVIGGGVAGYVCAIRAAQMGKKVILIEEKELGGVCLNSGCIPTKTLLYFAKTIDEVENLFNNFSIERKDFKITSLIDINKVREYKEKVIRRLRKGIEILLNKYQVEIIKDKAIFENEKEIKILNKDIKIKGENFVIASGSKPILLENIPKEKEIVWTSEEALEFKKIPEKLLIIGAGVVGLEIGEIYRSFGSEVIIVEIMPQILPDVDLELANYLQNLLEKKGFTFYLNSFLKEVDLNKRKAKILIKEIGEKEIDFETILLAIGRKPRSDELNLPSFLLDNKGYIITNDRMETKIKNIYAIGDVRKSPLLAHKAMYEGKKVCEILFQNNKEEKVFIPNCIYTEPEIASIGLTEKEVKENNYEYTIYRVPLTAIGRSLTIQKSEGFAKLIFDTKKREILGLHLLMPNASEIIGEGSIFLNLELEIEKIKKIIHPHPTLSEIIGEIFSKVLNEAIHTL